MPIIRCHLVAVGAVWPVVSSAAEPSITRTGRAHIEVGPTSKEPVLLSLEESVERVIGSYKAAVLAKNVDTFMHLYDPKVRVFDTWGTWSYEGADAWRIAVEGWLSSLGTEKVQVAFDEVHIAGNLDFALVTALVSFTAVSAQGETLRSMENRLTWALRTTGHVLRIVHEHSSAPIGFEDMKAILQRKPQA